MSVAGRRKQQHPVDHPEQREQDAELWRAFVQAFAEIAARDPRTASLLFSEERTAIA
jgi:hypothetical protein